MDIKFDGKYKSITSFNWIDIPDFVVITGPNGTGKSQLLELIYNTIINREGTKEKVQITGNSISPNDVTYLKGEWQLQNTAYVDLSTIQQEINQFFSRLKEPLLRRNEQEIRKFYVYQEILKRTGKKNFAQITKEEFREHFPELFIEQNSQLSQKIGQIFFNYRLSEIEFLSKGLSEEKIAEKIGEKPWIVLREIIRESKLPFEINDPSNNGIRDSFQLQLTNTILNEKVNFNDLSSGEKVLISLMIYLYNSQEKHIFPKLLLLDEPDAYLHPSMSQQLLNVLKNVLVDKFGVQVIMTTHSPSTVVLSPEDSIFEMSRIEPRIKKSDSKNHAVSLLTAGLVYVGQGTKYFLVEDNDDVLFYSYVYEQLTTENLIAADVPLVFIPASTKDKSGGKTIVQDWVSKLQSSGLINILFGLIDSDSENKISNGIFKINRYSIENYLADPILVYVALMDKEKNPKIDDVKLCMGEEYKLRSMSSETLQKIVDKIVVLTEFEVKNKFPDFNEEIDFTKFEVNFVSGQKLLYPNWLIRRRGKTIINEVYNKVFTSPVINFKTLFKSFKKLNMLPQDLVEKLIEIKDYDRI